MRDILFIIGSLQVGGAEKHLAAIAPRLIRKGWRPAIYSIEGYGPLCDELHAQGVKVYMPPIKRRGRSSPPMAVLRLMAASVHAFSIMVTRRPTIVHCFLPGAYLFGAPLALLARIRIRVMSRRSLNLYQHGRPGLRLAERILHHTVTAMLGNSRSVVRQLCEEEGVPPGLVGLIYNGVDVSRFCLPESRSTVRSALDLSPETVVLSMVGNLIPYKGHQDLLEALALASQTLQQDWRLLVIGRDDGIGQQLQAQAAALGLGDKIVFLGSRADVPQLLQASDVSLLCSHQEGFSNAILEGMAAGLPMIVTDVGGNAEAVLNGETGIVVPARDPAALAQAIARLVNDAGTRRTLGAAARERAISDFSIDRCVSRYDEFYRGLLEGKQPQEIGPTGMPASIGAQ
jgi:glycosyltransferase involved in cell wall biosynthesis